ncbi:glucans biosynthesis glucosyltransferase MdoH [Zhengella mangrovi]|uniref:glucans biosynthesis glucosyltransferase MdoH n=1 Tax=Zhengella mangrovi TaxID=1982044 RepID=UPI0013FD69A0|nr:glucans biosynthesis glucosyltransferase MdoH [Zhengella mangrovi]
MVRLRRSVSFIFSFVVAAIASRLAADVFFSDGSDPVDVVRILLLATTTAWIAWGASLAVQGVFISDKKSRPRDRHPVPLDAGKIGVLVPVYNEDPVSVASRVMAMARSVEATGEGRRFDFIVLSDTQDDTIANVERRCTQRLRSEGPEAIRFFYRRREKNTGKKAGNIAEFLRGSGAAYPFLVILDADSLMEGETMVEMVRRMEAEPRLGLLQTLPKIIHAKSWFGRAIQFSAAFHSPAFTRGLAAMQGRTGPFWGHNAIVRTRAFAESCGLPALTGKPPLGGHILSHDYVEAAMLARNGWTVRVDADLEGSYEEGPDNIIDFAKRDRRWCQGNLQHGRLLGAPGLKPWSRFVFAQGIMAYLASPLWLVFLVATLLAPLLAPPLNYFPQPRMPAIFPRPETMQAIALLVGIFGLLIGPKLLIAGRALVTGQSKTMPMRVPFLRSTVAEVLWSSVLAPITLMFQSRSVFQVLLGRDGGWPASNRDADEIGMRESWAASWWIVATGVLLLAGSVEFKADLFYWFLPVAVPMILAPAIISWSSRRHSGQKAAQAGLFLTPMELAPAPVIQAYEAHRAGWRHEALTPDVTGQAGLQTGQVAAS